MSFTEKPPRAHYSSVRSFVLMVLVAFGCARPSLSSDLSPSQCGVLDASQAYELSPGDAGSAPQPAFDAPNCRAGTYRGRFVCGSGASAVSGEMALTLIADSASTMHTFRPSTLAAHTESQLGDIEGALDGVVDCASGAIDMEVEGAYTVACLAIPFEGHVDGLYEAQRAQMRGHFDVLPDTPDAPFAVEVQCRWCASRAPSEAGCDPTARAL